MSIHAMSLVLDFAPAHWSSGCRMVAMALADRVNQDWQAWPSLDDLARRSGISTRQVRTYLRQLEDEGVIACHGQRIVNAQAYSNLWTWLWRIEMGAEAHFRGGRKHTSAPIPHDRAEAHFRRTVITNPHMNQGAAS